MNTTISPRETGGFLSEKQIEQYLQISGLKDKLSENDTRRFIAFTQEFNLNPFKREIHCLFDDTGKSRQVHIVVGYEVYIKRAERSGLLDGWTVKLEGIDDNLKAVIEIHRKDWNNPFIHEAYWTEAVQKTTSGEITQFWQRMPKFQLKKVAISQGFRLCFSDQLGGMPYEASELPIYSAPPEDPEPALSSEPTEKSVKPLAQAQTVQKPPFDPQTFQSPFIDLDHFLKANRRHFTANHIEWINAKLHETHTEEKARAMLAYARKFIQNEQLGLNGNQWKSDYRRRPQRIPGNSGSNRQTSAAMPAF